MAALDSPGGMHGPLLRRAKSLGQAERPPGPQRVRSSHAVPFDLWRLREALACRHCWSIPPGHKHTPGCPGASPAVYTRPLLAALAGGLLHRKAS